jgi:hypothetical protein
MKDLLQNDLFHLVFGILAAIFLLGAVVNAIRSRMRNNRRETVHIIKDNGNTGNERAPVKLDNPFAAQEPAAAAPTTAPISAQTPVSASATVVAADNPTGQSVKAPADDDEEYVWR